MSGKAIPLLFLAFLFISIISTIRQERYLINHSKLNDKRNKRKEKIIVREDVNPYDVPFEKLRNEELLVENFPTTVFSKWNHPTYPCFQGYVNHQLDEYASNIQRDDDKLGKDLKGLVYIKIHKASSSTLAGIALRISHRHTDDLAESAGKTGKTISNICGHWWKHRKAYKLQISNRQPQNTFLWSMVRHPTKRLVSHFYFFHVTSKRKATLRNLKKTIKQESLKNYQLNFLDPYLPLQKNETISFQDRIQRTLKSYDFIGLIERMDESLVVMRLLLNLTAADILYTKSKVSGNYVANLYYDCQIKPKPILTPALSKYVSSNAFFKDHLGDFLLYKAINKSLDDTIHHVIGYERFQLALKEHLYLMSLVHERCEDQVIGLCSKDGVSLKHQNNCYIRDFGCGYSCLDDLYNDYISTWKNSIRKWT